MPSDVNLSDQERELLNKMFASPLEFPTEYKGWLEDFIRLLLSAPNILGLDSKIASPSDLKLVAQPLSTAGEEQPQVGWLTCNGAAVSRTLYAALFDAIGTSYGVGDGSTTFNLPNLLGRVPVARTASGTFSSLGATGGAETHTLTAAEIPDHTHNVSTAGNHQHTQPAHAHSEFGVVNTATVTYGGADPVVVSVTAGSTGNAGGDNTGFAGDHAHAVDQGGGDGPHNNLQPYAVVGGWLIKF